MTHLSDLTLADIVRQNYKAAEVFEKYELDFCCKGKRSLQEACELTNIDLNALISDLNDLYDTHTDIIVRFNNWSLEFLADFIVKNHHDYVRNANERLLFYTNKIANVHGHSHPELYEVEEIFVVLAQDMEMHMRKEEFILFPYIKRLEGASDKDEFDTTEFTAGTVANPISRMEDEHEEAGKLLARLRELTNQFTPPAEACNTYRISFQELHEYERDLHQHIHLENNILFPKALLLEKNLQKTAIV
jgi:regulator of cell morphogenesis and NO signaling